MFPRTQVLRPTLPNLFAAGLAAGAVTGCSGPLSTLDPAGEAADGIATLWWVMLVGSTLIFIGMMSVALYALRRRRRGGGVSERMMLIGGGIVFPMVTLGVLLIWSLAGKQDLLPTDGRPIYTVEARGHQFWWEFIYPDVDGQPVFSATEVTVPANEPFQVVVTTEDVIHSFWVPRLGGKMDAVPGHLNTLRLTTGSPGSYLGRCSEFCGTQHLNMRLVVHAVPREDLSGHLGRLAHMALDPALPGFQDFQQHCAECHSIDPRLRGGPGPNLAHAAQRPLIEGNLHDWITTHPDPQDGERQERLLDLAPDTVDRIVAYLESAA